jgi:hypothetical protein
VEVLRERAYNVQNEVFLHHQQRGKVSAVETIMDKEGKQWASAGLEGRIVRRWQAEGPRFDSDAIGTEIEKDSPVVGKVWEDLRDRREMEDYNVSIAQDPSKKKGLVPGAKSASKVRLYPSLARARLLLHISSRHYLYYTLPTPFLSYIPLLILLPYSSPIPSGALPAQRAVWGLFPLSLGHLRVLPRLPGVWFCPLDPPVRTLRGAVPLPESPRYVLSYSCRIVVLLHCYRNTYCRIVLVLRIFVILSYF